MKQEIIQKQDIQPQQQSVNRTGIPTQMKLDFERRSGLSFDDVRVHYNSDKPARIGALAYTQGNQVHIGPGQERHLRHELGHVVQQKMKRITPNKSVSGFPINNDPMLEMMADRQLQSCSVAKHVGGLSHSMQIPYTSLQSDQNNFSLVIQCKQIIPLDQRLLAFDADVTEEISELKDLVNQYVALDNTEGTRKQQEYLLEQMALLLTNNENSKIKRAWNVIQDELFFVQHQNFSLIGSQIDPWEHMAKASYIRKLNEKALRQNLLPSSDKIMKPEKLISTLSSCHIKHLEDQLETWRSSNSDDSRILKNQEDLQKKIVNMLTDQGELVHYSHFSSLKIIHSSDYLLTNGVLSSKKENSDPKEDEITTKNQDVDFNTIGNTGFVFMFLEKKGDVRPTRFGKYRTSLPVKSAAATQLLKNSWAIWHDLVNIPSQRRPLNEEEGKKNSIVRITAGYTQSAQSDMSDNIIQSLQQQFTFFEETQKMVGENSRPLPIKTLINNARYKIEDNISGHLLFGNQIIPGIALRIVCELFILEKTAPEEAKIIYDSESNLWKYIKDVIFNMQIMIPHSVMPEAIKISEDKNFSMSE